MLENLPDSLGHMLRDLRPGLEAILLNGEATAGARSAISVSSLAFAHGEAIPARYSADGAGDSPPLAWRGVPPDAKSVVVLVEDADSPTPQPLVHAIVWHLPGADGALAEGAMNARGAAAADLGRNSYFGHAWLPPDPPPGHGPHRYVFQVFALREVPAIDGAPGRGKLREVLAGNVLACGGMLGTYQRGGVVPPTPTASAAAAI